MAEVLSYQPQTLPAVPEPELSGLALDGYGGAIENVQRFTPCYADTPIEEIQRRFYEDGVVLVKGLLDRSMINDFRSQYLSFVNEGTGLLREGTDPVDGIFSGLPWQNFLLPGAVRRALGLSDDGPFLERSVASHQSEFYQEFKNRIGEALEPTAGKICGFEQPWCLPRSLLRLSVPGGEATPVHYDQIFLRAGPPTSITAWVPIGDIDVKGGGLIYLNRSVDIGKKFEKDFDALNAELSDEERISAVNRNMNAGGWLDRNASAFGKHWGRTWLTAEYEAGDVVFHNAYMVHAGAKNQDPLDRIRVSTDLRFVDKNQPYDERWTFLAYSENDPNVAREKRE
ncbi:hypothetical protein GQ53DRAFT_660906 [Thozetella sp. PMI_491]|nr:hypothetical protein GQ53DRAFT_660906 [Thozetella sp. PMI_491]